MPCEVPDAAGHAVEVLQGLQIAEVGGDLLARAGRAREVHALQLFGQIGVGELVGRAVQGGEEAEAADEDDEFEAAEADGAAAGAEDEGGDLVEGVFGIVVLDGFEQAFPQAGMGEAAEVAGDGVGLAVFRGEGSPGVGRAGEVEYGVEAGAEVTNLAAGGGAGEDEGEEGVELEGAEGVGWVHGMRKTRPCKKSNKILRRWTYSRAPTAWRGYSPLSVIGCVTAHSLSGGGRGARSGGRGASSWLGAPCRLKDSFSERFITSVATAVSKVGHDRLLG